MMHTGTTQTDPTAFEALVAQFEEIRTLIFARWPVVVGASAIAIIFASTMYSRARKKRAAKGEKIPGWVAVLAFVLFTLGYWWLLGWVLMIVGGLLPEGPIAFVTHTAWRFIILGFAMFIAWMLVTPGAGEEDDGIRRTGQPEKVDENVVAKAGK